MAETATRKPQKPLKKLLTYKYVQPQYEENIKTYRYVGDDKSLLYAYVLTPIANFCLNRFVPSWLAPNLLTLMGFACVLIPHIILGYFYPSSLEGDVPVWLCLTLGVLHLTYMNFDNLDGKQARKTGNSSPLGLLFDHGCDSLVVMLQGISIATCLQFGNSYQSLVVYLIGCFPFFFTTLEEYYTNALILPVVNGPSEGCLVIGFFFFVSAFFGCQFWNEQDLIFPTARKNVAFALFVSGSVLNVSFNLYSMYYKVKGKFKDAMRKMVFYLYIILSVIFIFICSPTGIAQRQTRILIYILGLNFGKLATHLQIAHVSGSEFRQFRKTTFFIFAALNINTLSSMLTGNYMDEDTLLYILFGASLIVYGHLVFNVINQFTEVLKIKAFKVKQKST